MVQDHRRSHDRGSPAASRSSWRTGIGSWLHSVRPHPLISSSYRIDSNYSDLMRYFMKRQGKRKNFKSISKEQLTSQLSSIPIIFYDQLGGGRSTHRPDAPKDFWTPELFMDELDNLLKHLHVQDDFDLLGHSWGGKIRMRKVPSRVLTTGHRYVRSSVRSITDPEGLEAPHYLEFSSIDGPFRSWYQCFAEGFSRRCRTEDP